jgi:protein ImuB
MRHRRALELPLEESTAAPAPQQAPAPRSGDLLRPLDGRADAARMAPAELWLAVHLAASPCPPSQQDLERLIIGAQRLTPRVSLDPPDGLLLEVKGSLHLFGGVEGLSREMAGECSRLRMPCTLAVAPTPLAALALARARRKLGVADSPIAAVGLTDPAQLVGRLSPLPLAMLRWPQDTLERLERIGVRTIGEALRLPRAGFARRFGTAQLQTLDRLVGRASDLRDRFEVRARFRRRRELLYELESHVALLAVLAPLLEELGEFLEERQCGVLMLECRLRHRTVPPTRCVLRLAAPLADPAQIAALLGERLSTLVLPEAVRACELRSGALVARVLASEGLWQPGEQGGSAAARAPELIERLRVRLGSEAVYGLRVVDDHRAEAAWSVREPVITTSTIQSGLQNDPVRNAVNPSMEARGSPSWRSASGQDHFAIRSEVDNSRLVDRRPLWLLSVPRLLGERDGLPRRRGPLQLLGEAERIETGWWDGGEIARDYYTAVDVRGARLWVFREREPPHRWFLHGVFG